MDPVCLGALVVKKKNTSVCWGDITQNECKKSRPLNSCASVKRLPLYSPRTSASDLNTEHAALVRNISPQLRIRPLGGSPRWRRLKAAGAPVSLWVDACICRRRARVCAHLWAAHQRAANEGYSKQREAKWSLSSLEAKCSLSSEEGLSTLVPAHDWLNGNIRPLYVQYMRSLLLGRRGCTRGGDNRFDSAPTHSSRERIEWSWWMQSVLQLWRVGLRPRRGRASVRACVCIPSAVPDYFLPGAG